jgi:predicted dehydrogenase
MTVTMMHALEAMNFVLGDFTTVNAAAAVRRPVVRVIEDGSPLKATAFDHVALGGTLQNGAIASLLFRGAASRGDNLRWEITGTEGDLVLTATNGNLQAADLTLMGGRGEQTSVAPIALPTASTPSPTGPGANTLREYAALARDVRENTRVVPDFAHAVARHRLLAAIETAARTGVRQEVV